MEAVVEVPDRLVSSRAKRVVGPLARLPGEPRAALMLAIVAPSPDWWRVEPHIVWDPRGDRLPDAGVLEVAGQVVVVRYRGLRELVREGLERGLYRYAHLAGWGAPLLYAVEVREPDEAVRRVLRAMGAWRMLEWLREVRGRVRVVRSLEGEGG